MDMKKLLEAVDKFAGGADQKSGPAGQLRGGEPLPKLGSKKHPAYHKLVGGSEQQESVLKDLSKGVTPKTKEQELAEMWANFNEEDLGTHPKRPGRKSDRHARGHEPQPRYKTVKADEAVDQEYTVIIDRKGREKPVSGTMEELLGYFGYTLEVGKSYEHEKGRYKINLNPKNVEQLVDALNKAASNAAANSAPSTYYSVGENQLAESHYKWEITFKDGKKAAYHHDSPHYSDATAASDIRSTVKSNPGATVVATKDGKPFDWESLLNEAWGMGPKSYKGWTYDVWEDDDGDVRKKFHSAKKEGQEVDMDWSPYDTPDQKDWELWIDLGMPTREQLGLRGPMRSEDLLALAKTKQGTHNLLMKEAVLGGGGVKDLADYTEKRDYIYQQLADPKQADNYDYFRQALYDLMRTAREKGIKIEESRAHKQLDTWFKNRERLEKFAKGELKIPTPQERRAELEKQKAEKEKVDEYGTMPNQTASSANTAISTATTSSDPDAKAQAAKVAQATAAIKSATGTPASTTLIAKGLDAATQGKAVSAQDMKAIEPVMDVIGQAAQDPKLANQFKTLAQQARTAQQKQVGQQKLVK